jgi:PIN domain nuclease of toxin-antitoxin system
MRLLLDTHALLWTLLSESALSPKARAAITDPDNEIVVSAASAWEIATKHRIGKLPEAQDAAENLPAHLEKTNFTILPISLDHALAAGALPGAHKDPFDRMLIAQAQIEQLIVVTADRVFQGFDVAILW